MSGYCNRTDVEQVCGKVNVEKWSDMDDDDNSTNITSRITLAIELQYNRMNDLLRESKYTIPLVSTTDTTPVTYPYAPRFINATLAGVWLYEAKGVIDVDPRTGEAVHALQYLKQSAERELEEIVKGRRQINAK